VEVKEVLIRATSQRATATCSEEVGFDDGSSGCLTALRKRWRPTQTLRRAALGWLKCASAQARAFSFSEPANRPVLDVDLPFRVAILPTTIFTMTTDICYHHNNHIVSIRTRSWIIYENSPTSLRKGQVKLPQGFVIRASEYNMK